MLGVIRNFGKLVIVLIFLAARQLVRCPDYREMVLRLQPSFWPLRLLPLPPRAALLLADCVGDKDRHREHFRIYRVNVTLWPS
ncbi:unnamed protein product [Protopolystoma xenopodis]|uniref:Secreted protein n=1 Tax=Protopolystoma xenopodis TaxID=117903 RepID=A0A448WH40_9PLAT|nr:unnamed protein product [Protopolystoma xenopodis]